MSKAILDHDTWLYSADAPAGRLFGAGQLHPGEGWGDEPLPQIVQPQSERTDGDAIQAALGAQKAKFDEAWEGLSAEHDKALADIETLTAENEELRGQIAAFDQDGDGRPGGSKSKAEK